MRQLFSTLRRPFVVVAVVTAALGGTPAHAGTVFNDTYCGANLAVDGVYMRGCWYAAYEDGVFQGYQPGNKMRIPNPLDPAKWTDCTARLGQFVRHVNESTWYRYRTVEGSCLAAFKAHSRDNQAFRFYDSVLSRPSYGYCILTVARWFGTYDNQRVGIISDAGPFAHSAEICNTRRTLGEVDVPGTIGGDLMWPPADQPGVPSLLYIADA